MNLDDFLLVAKIGKAIGLKGECKIHSLSDFSEPFQKGSVLHLENGTTLTVEYFKADRSTIKFQEIHSREEIKSLTNSHLYMGIDESRELCCLREGEYFWFDLIGAKVIEEGNALGKVIDIERMAGSDYLLVESSEALQKRGLAKRFYIPYIQDRYILAFDQKSAILYTAGALEILEAS